MFWGQVTNCFTPITNENLCTGVFDFWCLVMSSQMAWACLPNPACQWHWNRMKQALRSPRRIWTIPDIPYSSRFPSPRPLFGFLASFSSLWLQSLWLSEVSFLVLTSKTRSLSEIRLLCAPREGWGQLSKWAAVRTPAAAHNTAVPPQQDLSSSHFPSPSSFTGMEQGQYCFSFQVTNCWTKDPNNLMDSTHRWWCWGELRCWVCPASPVPPSCPSLTPGEHRHMPPTCSATTSSCRREKQPHTVPPAVSGFWNQHLCAWIADTVLQSPFTGVVWVVVPLPMSDKPPEVGLSWFGKQHWKWASVHLSKCSWSLYLAVDTRSQPTLSFWAVFAAHTWCPPCWCLLPGTILEAERAVPRTDAPAQLQQHSAPLLGVAWPCFWPFFTAHRAWRGGREAWLPAFQSSTSSSSLPPQQRKHKTCSIRAA